MDITTGINLLVDFFSKNDSFEIEKDFLKLNWNGVDTGSELENKAAIIASLEFLCKENFLNKVTVQTSKTTSSTLYVILNSKKDSPIQINISPKTAEHLVEITNQFLPILDLNTKAQSNLNSLSEAEIVLLLQVVQYLAKQLNSEGKPNE